MRASPSCRAQPPGLPSLQAAESVCSLLRCCGAPRRWQAACLACALVADVVATQAEVADACAAPQQPCQGLAAVGAQAVVRQVEAR